MNVAKGRYKGICGEANVSILFSLIKMVTCLLFTVLLGWVYMTLYFLIPGQCQAEVVQRYQRLPKQNATHLFMTMTEDKEKFHFCGL